MPDDAKNPHFLSVASWADASRELEFTPVRPKHTLGRSLQSISIHVRGHRDRDLDTIDRSFEAHYGAFVVTQQAFATVAQARHFAFGTRYGMAERTIDVAGLAGRAYDLGPPVEPDDVDGRSPAVIVWHDRTVGHLIASSELVADDLLVVARSIPHTG